jgi:hypothetical protein
MRLGGERQHRAVASTLFRRVRLRGVLSMVALAAFAGAVRPGLPSQFHSNHPYDAPMGIGVRRANAERIRRLNVERQKELTADGVKLLAIATDLKTQVDRGEADKRSDDVTHEAEQIGKLAHGIQQKMKETYIK